eukprot:Gb_16541 [translate_table: standard]
MVEKLHSLSKPKGHKFRDMLEELKKAKARRDEELRLMVRAFLKKSGVKSSNREEEQGEEEPMEGLDEEEPAAVPCDGQVAEISEEPEQGQETEEHWEDAEDMFSDEPMEGPEEEKAPDDVQGEEWSEKPMEHEAQPNMNFTVGMMVVEVNEPGVFRVMDASVEHGEKRNDDDVMENVAVDADVGGACEQAKGALRELEMQKNEQVERVANEMSKQPKDGAASRQSILTKEQSHLSNEQKEPTNDLKKLDERSMECLTNDQQVQSKRPMEVDERSKENWMSGQQEWRNEVMRIAGRIGGEDFGQTSQFGMILDKQTMGSKRTS